VAALFSIDVKNVAENFFKKRLKTLIKTLALICSSSCLKPNAVIAVQLELMKEIKFYSISIQPCSHMTTFH